MLMKISIMEALEKMSEIIKLQTDIIDALAAELLQNGMITDSDLDKIKTAADMQKEVFE